ncbi:hypothetical protein ACMAUO_06045 [Gluconacetobacter sp. Hr-1-5]|uniref:hypothetical protein n=1 Tax=Gluconacetobacter sp. Hr-1-5 TaxID=3395370 RepID=UPI003B51CC4C
MPGVFEMPQVAIANLDKGIIERRANNGHGIVPVIGLLDDRTAMWTGKIGMCPQVSFGECADFDSNCCSGLYQRGLDNGIELFGHIRFLIESVNTSMMEAAGMADNGHSRLLGGAA